MQRITLTDTQDVRSLCALSDDEVLLVYDNLGLRAILLNSSLLYQHKGVAFREVRRMAFDTLTNTLLLLGLLLLLLGTCSMAAGVAVPQRESMD